MVTVFDSVNRCLYTINDGDADIQYLKLRMEAITDYTK